MKTKLLVMLCAGALSASALAQSPTARQRNVAPTVKDGTSVTLPPIEGCTTITDDAYNGTQGTMVCLAVPAPNVPGQSITDANVQLAIAHTWVGDLTMKIFPPGGGTPVTVTSRPGFAETADDGTGCCGDSSDMVQAAPITFDVGAFPSAETMGATEAIVCQTSGICTYTPNAGAATAGTLAAFNGLPADGANFMVCVGDSGSGDVGQLCDAQMTFTTGVAGDLSITKNAPSGITTSGVFPFDLAVANAGPAPHPGATVTDVLPAGLVYVGSSCGATAAGQTITWNAGALASGGSASCQIFVRQAANGCAAISNTATVVSTDNTIVDPPANNTSTFTNAPPPAQLLADPGFEAGTPNPSWTEASTNFGSPLCTVAGCGTGTGTGPQTGTFWVWFGGITALEVGSVEQSVVIPAGSATLNFGYESFVCGAGGAADFVRALIDGNEVWRRDATSANCGVLGYANQTVDISAYATGVSRVVRFESSQSTGSNFFVDNVTVNTTSGATCTAPIPTDVSAAITDAPDPVIAGQNLTYTATVTNNGPTFAENMALAVALPAGTTLVSAVASNGGVCAGSSCTWAGFSAPATSYTATVTVLVDPSVVDGTILTGTATASALTPESSAGNNVATTTTTVSAVADLVATLTASASAVLVNVPVTFSATSTNLGPSNAANLVLAITLSPDFRYAGHVASAGAVCTTPQVGNSGVISCTWAGATAVNGVRTLDVTAFSNNNNQNTVSVATSSGTPDPVQPNNAATVSVAVGYLIEEIPTLGRNALLMLGLMLALAGFVAVRRNS